MTAQQTPYEGGTPALSTARLGVTVIFFANGFGIGAWAVGVPQIKALFGLTDASLSLVLLAAGIGSLTAMPIAGLLPPRLGGTGRTLRFSGPAFAILLAALPIVHVFGAGMTPLVIAAFVFGVVNLLMDVPMNAHAAVVEADWGQPIMSSFHAAWSGGGLVGSAFGGLLISRGFGVEAQFGVEAALIFAAALGASFVIGVGDTHEGGKVFVLPERRLVALGIIGMLAVFAEGSITDWSALYLISETGLAPGPAAAGFSAYAFMMFLGRALGDILVRRLGRQRVIVYGAALVFAGVALAVGLGTAVAGVVGFCLVGLGVANMIPAAFSASAAAARSPSLGIAMAASLSYTALLLGPPIFGAVASVSSLRAAYAMLMLAAAVIAGLAMAQPRRGSSIIDR